MTYNDLFSPTKVLTFLQAHEVRLKKSLGQNFLIDRNSVEKIRAAAGLTTESIVVEVGAGIGTLTLTLALCARHVYAYEIDQRLIPLLKEVINGHEDRITVYQKDILTEYNFPKEPYIVVANLPYYNAPRIIRHFFSFADKPRQLLVVVQKEVGQRMCHSPGQASLLSNAVQLHARPQILFTISKNVFFPKPYVDSVVVKLDIRSDYTCTMDEERDLFTLIRAGFKSKRKQLFGNMKRSFPGDALYIEEIFSEMGISQKVRAEELGIDTWVQMHGLLKARRAIK